jgi:hypothetical protein
VSGLLTALGTSTLERLRHAFAAQRLRAPLTRADLSSFGICEQLDAVVSALEGHSRLACVTILDAVLAERAHLDRPFPELVWTGPEGMRAVARDTAVVLRELFESARSHVVLAGYSFWNAREVIGPLHEVMQGKGVQATFFVDVPQAKTAVPCEPYAESCFARFLEQSWPFGPPYPRLFCDRRALVPGPPWCSIHSKCVVVDGERAFVSSANFTARGQERNIEVGVLLHDAAFASQLERQWMSLIEADLVLRWTGRLDQSKIDNEYPDDREGV